jgi:hypothetical protein
MNARILIVVQGMDVEEVTSVEELILARNQLSVIDQGYQDLKCETPDWVIDKLTETNREIDNRVRSELMRRLKAAEARQSALRTQTEKRKDAEAEIADLKKRLA